MIEYIRDYWPWGSSPRAWGARTPPSCWTWRERIIPTSVGSTSSRTAVKYTVPGSSPRAWGAPANDIGNVPFVGIIPTSVGSTCCCCAVCGRSWDHPHERGEHVRPLRKSMPAAGSSPRAWGALRHATVAVIDLGIIPTSVGSTPKSARILSYSWDHPHERGEHRICGSSLNFNPGSSPRAWGALISPLLEGIGGRIIPTSVGSTIVICSNGRNRRDHPHERGEHVFMQ